VVLQDFLLFSFFKLIPYNKYREIFFFSKCRFLSFFFFLSFYKHRGRKRGEKERVRGKWFVVTF